MSDHTGGVRWNGAALDRHVCVCYHNDDDEYRLLRPFVADGFRQGDKDGRRL